MQPTDVVLEARDITVSFGGLRALTEATVHARAGRVHGVIGPNGAGKTTLFNVLCGYVEPESGRVLLGGRDVTGTPPHRRARSGIGRTFQRLELFPSLTVFENCMVPIDVRSALRSAAGGIAGTTPGRAARAAEARASAVLRDLGLDHLRDRNAGELPLGLGRLVELARALSGRPRVLLLDEPASGLTAGEKERMAAAVRSVTESGCAALLVEHDVDVVLGLSEHVWVLDAGEVIADGSPSAIRRDPGVQAAYLGTGV